MAKDPRKSGLRYRKLYAKRSSQAASRTRGSGADATQLSLAPGLGTSLPRVHSRMRPVGGHLAWSPLPAPSDSFLNTQSVLNLYLSIIYPSVCLSLGFQGVRKECFPQQASSMRFLKSTQIFAVVLKNNPLPTQKSLGIQFASSNLMCLKFSLNKFQNTRVFFV